MSPIIIGTTTSLSPPSGLVEFLQDLAASIAIPSTTAQERSRPRAQGHPADTTDVPFGGGASSMCSRIANYCLALRVCDQCNSIRELGA
jgi:hypothetical protein